MLNWRGWTLAIGICALFYMYRSAISCANFSVAVFKASVLNVRGDIGICALFYIYIDLPLVVPSVV